MRGCMEATFSFPVIHKGSWDYSRPFYTRLHGLLSYVMCLPTHFSHDSRCVPGMEPGHARQAQFFPTAAIPFANQAKPPPNEIRLQTGWR